MGLARLVVATGTRWRLAGWVWLALVMLITGAPARLAAAELLMFDEPGCPWCRKWDAEVGGAYPKSDEGRRAPLRRIHIARAAVPGPDGPAIRPALPRRTHCRDSP